jgi:hypothetical protein
MPSGRSRRASPYPDAGAPPVSPDAVAADAAEAEAAAADAAEAEAAAADAAAAEADAAADAATLAAATAARPPAAACRLSRSFLLRIRSCFHRTVDLAPRPIGRHATGWGDPPGCAHCHNHPGCYQAIVAIGANDSSAAALGFATLVGRKMRMHASGCRPAPVGEGPPNAIAPESGRRLVDALDPGVGTSADRPWARTGH